MSTTSFPVVASVSSCSLLLHYWHLSPAQFCCYSSFLFVLGSYHVLSVGTCRSNRKGWPKEMMNLVPRSSTRGDCKMAYSKDYGVAAFQWMDTKVVNCVSSYIDFGMSEVQRQIGSRKESFPCPIPMRHYQMNMGGVDKADQLRVFFGGFASVAHFKKWYKKAIMAVLDCMLMNGLQLWNATAAKVPGRKRLKRHEYLLFVANYLLTYKSETLMSPEKTNKKKRQRDTVADDEGANDDDGVAEPFPVEDGGIADADDGRHVLKCPPGTRCVVCQLETTQYQRMWKKVKREAELSERIPSHVTKERASCGVKGTRKDVARCQKCKVNAHYTLLPPHQLKVIHGLFPPSLGNQKMSCMQILHSGTGREIWTIKHDPRGGCRVAVKHSHPIVKELSRQVAADLGIPEEVEPDSGATTAQTTEQSVSL